MGHGLVARSRLHHAASWKWALFDLDMLVRTSEVFSISCEVEPRKVSRGFDYKIMLQLLLHMHAETTLDCPTAALEASGMPCHSKS